MIPSGPAKKRGAEPAHVFFFRRQGEHGAAEMAVHGPWGGLVAGPFGVVGAVIVEVGSADRRRPEIRRHPMLVAACGPVIRRSALSSPGRMSHSVERQLSRR